jgi:hypothetical protein
VIYCGFAFKSQDRVALYKALLFLGDLFNASKDEETASILYVVALEGFTQDDVHCSRAQCLLHLGDLANRQGIISTAIVHWKEARPLFDQSLQAKDVAQIDCRLLAMQEVHQKAFLELSDLHASVQQSKIE